MKTMMCWRSSAMALLFAALLPNVTVAASDMYPERPVTMVVGYQPGGSSSILARLFAEEMSKRLEQTVIVENKPGANSNIAAQSVATSKSDGYTLMLVTISNAINQGLYPNLRFNFKDDFSPIGLLAKVPNVLVVNPNEPIHSLKDYIEFAKHNPGKLTCASAGIGSSIHLSCELFKLQTQTDILHVSYKGSGPANADLIAGHVASMFDNLSPVAELIRSETLRPIGVTSDERSPAFPDVPTIAEAGLEGFSVYSWFGLVAPQGTPSYVVEKLNDAVNEALTSTRIQDFLMEKGYLLPDAPNSSGEFEHFIHAETDRWGQVVTQSNIKLE